MVSNSITLIALDIDTGKEYAVKLECTWKRYSMIKIEAMIYRLLSSESGFPKIYWTGTEGEYNVLVMELLGPNFETLMHHCNHRFSIATTFALAAQMVT